MLGREEDSTLNNVSWSLVFELRISLMFPLYYIAKNTPPITQVLFAAGCITFTQMFFTLFKIMQTPYYDTNVIDGMIITVHFVTFFFCGAVLAIHRDRVKFLVRQLPSAIKFVCAIAALALMTRVNDFISCVGSAMIIALSISLKADRFNPLVGVPQLWLGKISYSLYLVHLPIIIGSYYLLSTRTSAFVAVVIGVGLSFFVAPLFHFLVEKPSQQIGRSIASLLEAEAIPRPKN